MCNIELYKYKRVATEDTEGTEATDIARIVKALN
jgi:hypothetical protein